MSKSTTRILILVGIACRILGGLISLSSVTTATLGLILLVGALALYFVGVIGALVKMAQLQRWGWFVALLFILPVLVYIFWGPSDTLSPAGAVKPRLR